MLCNDIIIAAAELLLIIIGVIILKCICEKLIVIFLCVMCLLASTLTLPGAQYASAKIQILDAWLSFEIWTGEGDSGVEIDKATPFGAAAGKMDIGSFEKLTQNGTELAASNYTVKEDDGRVNIVLKEKYLSALEDGIYNFNGEFANAVIPLRLYVVTHKVVLSGAVFNFDEWNGSDYARVNLDPNTFAFTFSSQLFQKLSLNGSEVDRSCYEISEHGYIPTLVLKEAYVKTLSPGIHCFEAEFMNATVMLRLKKAPYLTGDIDGDRAITSADARLCLRAAVSLIQLDNYQKDAADVFGDGKICAENARKILRVAVRLDRFER